MTKSLLLIATVGLIGQAAYATPKADSIKAFTGAARAKFVWERRIMADANYNPITPKGTRFVLFDTDEGVDRTLDSVDGYIVFTRISRSGKWATWHETNSDGSAWVQKTAIIDLTTPNAKKRYLLDKATCTYWCARAWWIDHATGTEYVFCINDYGGKNDAIYKVPVKVTGDADLTGATKVYQSTAKVDDVLSLSEDGTKLGGAFPWPTTKILDLTTGTMSTRHNSSSSFGCQANLAPDNSYRFFHCADDHRSVYMFGPAMSTETWQVDLNKNLASVPSGFSTDFESPRWSNHPQFFCNSFPLDRPDMGIYSSAAAIKALTLSKVPCTLLEKLSPDFKSVESSIMIGGDVRYQQYRADGWLSNGITDVNSAITPTVDNPASRVPSLEMLRVEKIGPVIYARFGTAVNPVTTLTDTQGKILRRWTAAQTPIVDTRTLNPGVFLITVNAGSAHLSERVIVK